MARCEGTFLGGQCPACVPTDECVLHGPKNWRQEVKSSAIRLVEFTAPAWVGESEPTGVLKITFVDGTEESYSNVDMTVYYQLVKSDSIGRFYNQNIRGVLAH